MSLLRDVLIGVLQKEKCRVEFEISAEKIVESINDVSLKILQEIKAVLEDEALSAEQCLERISCVFKDCGITLNLPSESNDKLLDDAAASSSEE